jgi:hypothetical protein
MNSEKIPGYVRVVAHGTTVEIEISNEDGGCEIQVSPHIARETAFALMKSADEIDHGDERMAE